MMFMMPMPPTSSEMAAMLPRSSVMVPVVSLAVCMTLTRLRTWKSSDSPCCRPWRARSRAVMSLWVWSMTSGLAAWMLMAWM